MDPLDFNVLDKLELTDYNPFLKDYISKELFDSIKLRNDLLMAIALSHPWLTLAEVFEFAKLFQKLPSNRHYYDN